MPDLLLPAASSNDFMVQSDQTGSQFPLPSPSLLTSRQSGSFSKSTPSLPHNRSQKLFLAIRSHNTKSPVSSRMQHAAIFSSPPFSPTEFLLENTITTKSYSGQYLSKQTHFTSQQSHNTSLTDAKFFIELSHAWWAFMCSGALECSKVRKKANDVIWGIMELRIIMHGDWLRDQAWQLLEGSSLVNWVL